MRRVKLLGLMALALFAFGAVSAAVASAEDGEPALLCLEECTETLKATFKGGANTLSTLGGKVLEGTGVEGKVGECLPLAGSKKDTSLCHKTTLDFTGVKLGKVACRSENAKAEKDAVETVLVLTDLHLASEETLPGKLLQPLALFKVVGSTEKEAGEELTLNCGGVKDKVKGVLPCLLSPGLENIPTTKEVEVKCSQGKESHDQETGMCEKLCEWLTEHPFESNLGAGFEDAGMNVSAKGKFNFDIFLDD